MASLIGVQPVGLAGPNDACLALGGNYSPPPGAAYMSWGGVPPEWGRLSRSRRWRSCSNPTRAAGAVSVELADAVEVARDGELATLMADGEGFQVAITAPPGSVAVVVNGGQPTTTRSAASHSSLMFRRRGTARTTRTWTSRRCC